MPYRVSTSEIVLTIQAGNNKSQIIPVPATPTGHIVRIAAKQTQGNNTAFTVYVFNTSSVTDGEEQLYSIVSPISVSSGSSALEFSSRRWFYNNLTDQNSIYGFYVQVRTPSNVSAESKFKVCITWMSNEF